MIELLHIGGDSLLVHPYKSDCAEMLFCTEGAFHIYINQLRYEMYSGCAIVIFPGQIVLFCEVEKDTRLTRISLPVRFFHDLLFPIPNDLISFLREHNACRLQDAGVQAIQKCHEFIDLKLRHNGGKYLAEQIMSCLRTMIYEIAEQAETMYGHSVSTSARWELKDRFVSLVERDVRQFRCVDHYSDKLCVTTRHLSKVIKQTLGYSAKEWIDNYSILEIKVALRTESMSIQELAREFCFPDASTFSRYFKTRTGHSPSEYRILISSEISPKGQLRDE